MAVDAHKNLAVSLVATAPVDAVTGTSLEVTVGEGARFPAVPFNAIVWPADEEADPSNSEILRVTARATDTFTIARSTATEPNTIGPRAIVVGDRIIASITAKTLLDAEVNCVVDIFTASGTWTKPAGAKSVHVLLIGGGGGGGSGRKGPSATIRCGGGGASGGAILEKIFRAALLGSTETVTVGTGGAGGAAQVTNGNNGNIGTAGLKTSFGTWASAAGGQPGSGGTTTTGLGGPSVQGWPDTVALYDYTVLVGLVLKGGIARTTGGAGGAGGAGFLSSSGGGAGGGLTSASATSAGGAGGAVGVGVSTSGYNATLAGGAGGTVGAGQTGSVGNASPTNSPIGGSSGGGGASSTSGTAGTGGAGATYGGAGGGGGSAVDSTGNSGAGGAGANGIAIITTYY